MAGNYLCISITVKITNFVLNCGIVDLHFFTLVLFAIPNLTLYEIERHLCPMF